MAALSTAEVWGRIYAVLEQASGKKAKASLTNSAAHRPGFFFGEAFSKVQARRPEWADGRLQELLENISPRDMEATLSLEDQGKFFLGLYHERTRMLEMTPSVAASAGRPQKGSSKEVDWSTVDWSLSNAEISRERGVTRQAVAAARKRHEIKEQD